MTQAEKEQERWSLNESKVALGLGLGSLLLARMTRPILPAHHPGLGWVPASTFTSVISTSLNI